jgi:DNA mismatch repair protein MutH
MLRCTIAELQERLAPVIGKPFKLPKTANKGAVGLWLETATGIPHSGACLDCIDGELKTFPLKRLKAGSLVPKETVAITMLCKDALKAEAFADSRCAKKMATMLMVPYLREGDTVTVMTPKILCTNDAAYKEVYETFRQDYETIRTTFCDTGVLASTTGKYLQNRTKGAGRGAPKTRAFYLRAGFLKAYCI